MIRQGALFLGAAILTAPTENVPLNSVPISAPGLPVLRGGTSRAGLLTTSKAAIPVALSPARPFYLGSGPEDRARAIDCLAAADYYEAGSGTAGQRAVAQVVLNRVRHAAFPATICGVVFAGAERVTGCQFTFTCDGSLDRRRPSLRDWRQARETAAEMLLGRVEGTVGEATHYHTDWVSPPWDREMDKLAVVDTHLFFRWRGSIGASTAFNRRYLGGEPRIARLANLSMAHVGTDPDEDASPALSENSDAPKALAASEPGLFLVTLPAHAPTTFVDIAKQRCAGLEECRFIGWTDPSRRARSLPLSGNSVDAMSFSFVRRPGTPDEALWNCSEFAVKQPQQCMMRGS